MVKSCLLLLPARKKTLKKELVRILNSLNIKPLTVEDLFLTKRPLVENLQIAIKNSDLVIADITGENPNIMFEIGMCFAYKKPVVILTRSNKKVPFDVRNSIIVEYDYTLKGLKKMRLDLKNKLLMFPAIYETSLQQARMSASSFIKSIDQRREDFFRSSNIANSILDLHYGNNIRGFVFESLISELFRNEGFEVINTETKLNKWPVDFVLQTPSKSELLLVDCKTRDIRPKDIVRFANLLDNRRINKGIIVTSKKLTKVAKDEILEELEKLGKVIISIDIDDFRDVASGTSFSKILENKIANAEFVARLI